MYPPPQAEERHALALEAVAKAQLDYCDAGFDLDLFLKTGIVSLIKAPAQVGGSQGGEGQGEGGGGRGMHHLFKVMGGGVRLRVVVVRRM